MSRKREEAWRAIKDAEQYVRRYGGESFLVDLAWREYESNAGLG